MLTHFIPLTVQLLSWLLIGSTFVLNQHFTSTSQRLLQTRASSLYSILQFIDSLPDSRHADELELCPVSYSEVLKSLASMRLDCSTGADQIPAKYLKLSAEYISSPLTHIINCFISSHSFPKAWKNARASPIPKVDSPVEADDYCPIAILPFLSKVYERLVLSQLVSYIKRLHVYSDNIAGYRKGHCITTILMRIRDDINAMKKGEVTLIASLIFPKRLTL